VVRFAKANGFAVVGGSRDGMKCRSGPSLVRRDCFHVLMRTTGIRRGQSFLRARPRTHHQLGFPLWHISGLDNYSIPHPMFVKKSDYARVHGIEPEAVVRHATTGSGPSASFLGSDMRAAYYGGTALDGTGKTLDFSSTSAPI